MQDSLNPSSDLSYNRGNMFYKSQMLDESLKFFRDALLKNPEDDDARKNYEVVKNETFAEHSFNIILKNEDYTIGKIIEFLI